MFKKKSRSETDDGKVSLSFSIEVETHNAGRKKKKLWLFISRTALTLSFVCMMLFAFYLVMRLTFVLVERGFRKGCGIYISSLRLFLKKLLPHSLLFFFFLSFSPFPGGSICITTYDCGS